MASSNRDPQDGALDPIEAQVERDRADLVSTLDALRRRIGGTSDGRARAFSADALRSQAGRYAADRRRGMVSGLGRRLRERPLETAAVATVAAYPLVRLATRVPLPILLMGAGVALARRGGGSGGRDGEGQGAVIETEPVAVGGAAPVRGPRVSTVVAPEAVGAEPGAAAPSASQGTAAGETAQERAARLARGASEGAARAGRRGGETLAEAIARRPAAAAGASLLIGGALAMILPRSRAEGRLFGEASEEVRARARALASEGVESGRRAVEAARAEAARQGLGPDGARRVVAEVGGRAEAALDDMARDAAEAIARRDDRASGGGGEPGRSTAE